MTNHKATPEQWATMQAKSADPIFVVASCVEELRARVEQLEAGLKDEADCNKTCTFNIVDRVKALEAKYETMRLATLEWGKDVDNMKHWLDKHHMRLEALEADGPASRVYEVNEPLQLTPKQAQHVRDLLTPNSKPTPNDRQIRSSLVDRVERRVRHAHEVGGFQARAAIREVAAWLREQQDGDLVAATVLEREAER